ncbi:hypothetical protein SAMN05421809_0800 [Natronorubrum daqingense]|uniref:Uncharacterized protein n=1 Tax=Natronorubrum daqingense TaxID=588898 RepID=A0A1N6ZGV1_9EURY|nr:hypothetical protein SAMN05421809_0800 [Natronorubrum daqingense]
MSYDWYVSGNFCLYLYAKNGNSLCRKASLFDTIFKLLTRMIAH